MGWDVLSSTTLSQKHMSYASRRARPLPEQLRPRCLEQCDTRGCDYASCREGGNRQTYHRMRVQAALLHVQYRDCLMQEIWEKPRISLSNTCALRDNLQEAWGGLRWRVSTFPGLQNHLRIFLKSITSCPLCCLNSFLLQPNLNH